MFVAQVTHVIRVGWDPLNGSDHDTSVVSEKWLTRGTRALRTPGDSVAASLPEHQRIRS
jgi:hypothetical protein